MLSHVAGRLRKVVASTRVLANIYEFFGIGHCLKDWKVGGVTINIT